MAGTIADAQPSDPIDALLYGQTAPVTSPAPQPYDGMLHNIQTARHPLSASDSLALRSTLEATRRRDLAGARNASLAISDSLARKIATWAITDSASDQLSFYELDAARRDLSGWPRGARRQAAAEKLLETAGKTPAQVIDWFGGSEPDTAQGAMALASAYRQKGRGDEAKALIRKWWRGKSFEADVQRNMLARFGDALTAEDHARRADFLLYGQQGPAARDLIPLLSADQQQAALARIALRADAGNAQDLAAMLPPSVASSPGVVFERASYMRRKGMDTIAIGSLANFPNEVVTADQGSRIWSERYRLVQSSLRNSDPRSAYAAAANSGLTVGGDAADAEFYAGWIALNKLNDAKAAERHFNNLEKIGTSPITRGRALYWLGRTEEKQGDKAGAERFYGRAAEYSTTFYGQLALEKLGKRLVLPADPTISAAERAKFEGMETVQAARLLYDQGQRDLFRAFMLHLDDVVQSTQEVVQLVDMARGYGEQDTSMKVVRAAAQRGLIVADRGYPVRTPPDAPGAPETALVLGITRQESGFDPLVRSGVGARGMMQLMPATASVVARRMGVSYSPDMLDQPDYNMRLGSSFLGQLVSQFSGSYVMAIAGYNAGPGRPTQWSAFCGDPRTSADPLDFIECIPFGETRNYVMRVMEGMTVYRARLNGGSAPITLSGDLKRGSYSYPTAQSLPVASAMSSAAGVMP